MSLTYKHSDSANIPHNKKLTSSGDSPGCNGLRSSYETAVVGNLLEMTPDYLSFFGANEMHCVCTIFWALFNVHMNLSAS